MLDEDELATYAAGAADALRVMGPTTREQALRMLCRLHLTEAEATVVISYGVERGVLVEEDGQVGAP
jgi:hypothetical protein